MKFKIAHRGGSGNYIENSLPAFKNAMNRNCDMAELDVHLTKDGYVVVHHNNKLNSNYCKKSNDDWLSSDEELLISELTLSKLQEFTIGEVNPNTDYGNKFPYITAVLNQNIPTLQEVIKLVKESSDAFELVIEIKTDIFKSLEKYYEELVDKVLCILQEENFTHRSVFCSFDWNSLVYAKTKNKLIRTWFTTLPLSWLENTEVPTTDIPPRDLYLKKLRKAYSSKKSYWHHKNVMINSTNLAYIVKELGGDALFCYYSDVYSSMVEDAFDINLSVMAWSVNLTDKTELKKVQDSKIDGFCTDYL